jgi:hypothetical protein
MKGKKGFELTATFLVTLILIIVIFIGSLYFTRRFFSTAEEMRAEIDAQTEAEIEALLYQEGALVAMPKFKKQVARGQSETFGIGIRNVLDQAKDFYVNVAFTTAFTIDEETITGTVPDHIDSTWLLYSQGPYTIQNNELQLVPILAHVDLSMGGGLTTEKGIYSFNVCVFGVDEGGSPPSFNCESPAKSQIPQLIYGGKIYKMYVEVI